MSISPAYESYLSDAPKAELSSVDRDVGDKFSIVLSDIAKNLDYKPATWDFPPYPSQGKYDRETLLRAFLLGTENDHGFWEDTDGQYKHFHGFFDGKEIRGSDALWYALGRELEKNPNCLEPEQLMDISEEEAAKFFRDDKGVWFPRSGNSDDYEVRDNPRLLGRIEILRGAARILHEDYDGSVEKLIESANGYLVTDDGTGLLQILSDAPNSVGDGFPGYRDKWILKKGWLFTMFLKDRPEFADIYNSFVDKESRFIPLDYHLMKNYLRTGLVKVDDEELWFKLNNLIEVEPHEEESIRMSSLEATRYFLNRSEVPTSVADNIIWSHGRKQCTYEPNCDICNDFSKVCSHPNVMFPIFKTEAY
jgi:hypothetical protein